MRTTQTGRAAFSDQASGPRPPAARCLRLAGLAAVEVNECQDAPQDYLENPDAILKSKNLGPDAASGIAFDPRATAMNPHRKDQRVTDQPPRLTWRLRDVMAERGILHISDLIPALTDRGIPLSRAAIYSALSAAPDRISLSLLAALCDVLECTPNDLLQPRPPS